MTCELKRNSKKTTTKDYIPIKGKACKYLPHTAGRYQVKRFRKALCPIVERLCNSLMMHGRNNGKKLMAVRIVKHTFEIIHLLTGEVRYRMEILNSNFDWTCFHLFSKIFLESIENFSRRHQKQWTKRRLNKNRSCWYSQTSSCRRFALETCQSSHLAFVHRLVVAIDSLLNLLRNPKRVNHNE